MKRRRQTVQGPQDLKNNMVMNFMSLIFITCIPDCVPEKPATQKHQGHKQKGPKQSWLFLCKRLGRKQPSKTEKVYTITRYSSQTPWKYLWLNPYFLQQRPSWESGFPPLPDWNEVFPCPSLTGVISEKAEGEAKTFNPGIVTRKLPPL